ncbi:MAG: glycosyltransferase family 39 protein [Isosphaeraceae bacterium]
MYDQAGFLWASRRSPATILIWLLLSSSLVLLICLVLARHGNLAWDDADYLRRGLADARHATSGTTLAVIPRLLARLIKEQPKPPLLVGWIALGALLTGRSHIDMLMVYSSVVPFLLLALGTVGLARRFHGPAAGLLALAFLLASPRALSFGGKVMVETFLAFWVLLALGLASELAVWPRRTTGIALGLATGLALLTKLTAVLLLAGTSVSFLWWMFRPGPDRSLRKRTLGWAIVTCLAVAGPWYACNARAAVRFGTFSARYNLLAEGQPRIVAPRDRLGRILSDLPGWPLIVMLGVVGFGISVRRGSNPTLETAETAALCSTPARFRVLVVASTLVAAGALMIPAYFDTRFLLPLWPSIAVVLGGALAQAFRGLTFRPRVAIGAALAASLAASIAGVVGEPASTTCWAARGLIDQIVSRYGVTTLANVGNVADWNVCKTGLINELRDDPRNCFVLHDLSAESAEGLRTRLPRFDAVVVLETAAFPSGFLAAAPRLNCAYPSIFSTIEADPALVRLDGLPLEGLPPLTIYVRRGERSRTHVMPSEFAQVGGRATSTRK